MARKPDRKNQRNEINWRGFLTSDKFSRIYPFLFLSKWGISSLFWVENTAIDHAWPEAGEVYFMPQPRFTNRNQRTVSEAKPWRTVAAGESIFKHVFSKDPGF